MLGLIALAALPPLYVAATDRDGDAATLMRLDGERVRKVAAGRLGYDRGDTMLDLATDGRRIVVLVGRGRTRKIRVHPVFGTRIAGPKSIAATPGTSAILASEGRFLIATRGGVVARVLPDRRSPRLGASAAGNGTVAFGLTRDRLHYTMVTVESGLGDTSWSHVRVGLATNARIVQSAEGGSPDLSARFSGALYLPSSKEAWTLDGTASIKVWKIVRSELRLISRRITLPTPSLQAMEVRSGIYVLWDAYGSLALGRVERDIWRPLGRVARLASDEVGESVSLRVTRDGEAIVVGCSASGSLWRVPVVGGRSLGTPRRLWRGAEHGHLTLSY